VVPYAVVAPYSKMAIVLLPFGLTVPFRTAVVAVISVAKPVTTVGGRAANACVGENPRARNPNSIHLAMKAKRSGREPDPPGMRSNERDLERLTQLGIKAVAFMRK
jgi:hypothetical protein